MTEARVALITGALGGIGEAAVSAFRQAGFEVVGADRRPGAEVTADVATSEGARSAVEPAAERGHLKAVFLAHGISGRDLGDGPVADCTEEGWDAVLDGNLRSTFLVCKHAVPRLSRPAAARSSRSVRCSASLVATKTSTPTRTRRARPGSWG